MVKFFKYKQIARLAFFGFDDELLNDDSSIYRTKLKGQDFEPINTKKMIFKLDSSIQNIKLGKNARMALESVHLADLFKIDGVDFVKINSGTILLKMKNLNGDCFDSTHKTYGNTLLFTGINGDYTYINTNPDKLYNFSIPSNFLNYGSVEFEIIYHIVDDENIDLPDIYGTFKMFHLTLIIFDENEEDLLLKDTDEVDYKLIKPFNNGIPIYK